MVFINPKCFVHPSLTFQVNRIGPLCERKIEPCFYDIFIPRKHVEFCQPWAPSSYLSASRLKLTKGNWPYFLIDIFSWWRAEYMLSNRSLLLVSFAACPLTLFWKTGRSKRSILSVWLFFLLLLFQCLACFLPPDFVMLSGVLLAVYASEAPYTEYDHWPISSSAGCSDLKWLSLAL